MGFQSNRVLACARGLCIRVEYVYIRVYSNSWKRGLNRGIRVHSCGGGWKNANKRVYIYAYHTMMRMLELALLFSCPPQSTSTPARLLCSRRGSVASVRLSVTWQASPHWLAL